MPKQIIFDKKNILVTGGAGFIGSHLCDELIRDNKVICLDNFSTGDEKNIDHLLSNRDFEFVKHDVSEPLDFERLPELKKFRVQFQGIQEIYHLACPTSPLYFENNKLDNLKANSLGVKNVLDLAVRYRAKIVHFSSSVVYGPRRDDKIKVKEEDIGAVDQLSPRSSYDEGKRFAETLVFNYRQIFKVDAKIIRLFRIYGPRMKLSEGHMIPDFINNSLENKDLIVTGDENFSSSFCYVSDVINAARRMMESDLAGPINIGSDLDLKITEVAKKIIARLGSKSKISFSPKMLFMTPLCLPDIRRAREELGWMPIVNLEKGLDLTIEDLRAGKGLLNISKI